MNEATMAETQWAMVTWRNRGGQSKVGGTLGKDGASMIRFTSHPFQELSGMLTSLSDSNDCAATDSFPLKGVFRGSGGDSWKYLAQQCRPMPSSIFEPSDDA